MEFRLAKRDKMCVCNAIVQVSSVNEFWFSLFIKNTGNRVSLFAMYFRTIWESLQKRVSSMGKSNCFEIVFLRRIANVAVCSSKRSIVMDFSLIGARRDYDKEKLEIYFLEHSEK